MASRPTPQSPRCAWQADTFLQDVSPSALAAAVEANINAQIPLLYAHMPGVEVIDEPDLLGMMSDLPDLRLNSIYWASFPSQPEQVEARIDRVLDRNRAHGQPPMTWVVSPSTRPRDLGRYLQARGFNCAFCGVPGMALDLGAFVEPCTIPAGLSIERVGDLQTLRQWLHPVAASFDFKASIVSAHLQMFSSQGFGLAGTSSPAVPWQLFVGLQRGEPVAASRLFCAAGVAGIYHVAAVPEARGQGVGTAMALAAIRAGRDLGYRVAILTASGEGYSLYRRLGFRTVTQADIYWMK
jgi:ribosomal protein S18 acetylase RimI-like enzyme